MEEKEVIKLKYSIPIPKEGGGEVNISEITIGRVKGKHLKLLPDEMFDGGKVPPARMVDLVAALADIPIESAGELDFTDLIKIAERAGGFLENSLGETGKS